MSMGTRPALGRPGRDGVVQMSRAVAGRGQGGSGLLTLPGGAHAVSAAGASARARLLGEPTAARDGTMTLKPKVAVMPAGGRLRPRRRRGRI
jgi:hypothetical protein